MITKQDVNSILYGVVKKDFADRLWWGLKLPGLGGKSPDEVWQTSPQTVLEYAKGYLDESFS